MNLPKNFCTGDEPVLDIEIIRPDGELFNSVRMSACDADWTCAVYDQQQNAGVGWSWRNRLEPALGQPAEPTEAQIVAAYMAAVQRHMDARAVSFGYDNLISVITYAEEPAVARYQAEGQAFRAWRSACWRACEQMLEAVKSGERSAPTHAELIAELPGLGIEYSGPFAATA